MMSRQAGFTLIEVLLAIAITAFVAVLAYSGLSVAVTGSERHQQHAEQQAELQMALSLLEKDVRQITARVITDEYDEQQPALAGGALEDYILQLSRRGWDNPLELRRASLQRVRYQLEDNVLWREYWPVMDRSSEDEGLQRLKLLENVDSIKLRFLDDSSAAAASSDLGGEWQESWPPAERALNDLPLAIDLELELLERGRIRRVIEITAVQ
jgi:general secretion pathway protein J